MLSECFVGKIVQCHIDCGDPESFVLGRLVYSDSKWFMMQDISPAGRWNGLALYMQSDIVSVSEFTDYIRKITLLLKYRNEPMPFIPPMAGDPLTSLLLYAKELMRVVGLELHASGYRDVNGTINHLSNHIVCIDQIDEFGRPDGKSYIFTDAITRCFIGDEESECLEILLK